MASAETKEIKARVSFEVWKELKILSIQNDSTIQDEAAQVLEKIFKGKKKKEKEVEVSVSE